MNNRITRREFGRLAAAGASVAALGGMMTPGLGRHPAAPDLVGQPRPRQAHQRGRRPLQEGQCRASPSTPKPMPGTTTGRSSPRRRPGRTCPTSSRWTTATSSNTRGAASSPTSRRFVGKEIDLADFDPNQLESGKVDGKLYGISMGANSMTHVYKPAMLEQLGLTLPDPTKWTIDDFVAHGQGGEGQAARRRLLLARTWPIASRGSRPGCASAARSSTPPTASSATTSRT